MTSVSAALLLALCPLRASGKGCFLGSAEVTLADGSRRQLRDIREGDLVASWDETLQRPAVSEVKAVPEFDRDRSELVEISVPGASFHATVDHPFWSRGRGSLVSFHPNATWEEYGLAAESMGPSEELEGERQEAVPVTSARRLLAAGRAPAFLQQSPADTVKVTTLCLHPHHWFYVHGVRVHNKGCFLGGTAVTMADGTRRQLQDVAVGDQVASWDDQALRPVVSTVRAVPTYRRSRDELVEISLPSSTLHATVDHPFWSRARRGLVSRHPDSTRDQYELDAELMNDTEEFEGERQEAVVASGVRQISPRRLGLALAGGEEVEVMTLCLEPHHWFYAEGVRVHNKGGCFAPWTPVVMEDGTQRPIEQVRAGDRVASWDTERGTVSSAEVLGLEVWPAGELMEVSLGPAEMTRARFLGAASQGNWSRSLVVTPDHPIYSVRHGGLVSMRPDRTRERYALSTAQMRTRELLHHHLNGTVAAEVLGAWQGFLPDQVITLRLDRHHWFYAHGVRVHNKGGGGGGYGGSGGGSGIRTHSRASMGATVYMNLILMNGGSRRRYGTYHQEEGTDGVRCKMKSEAEVEEACMNQVGSSYNNYTTNNTDYCFPCIECESKSCIGDISATDGYDCAEFLGDAFSECTEDVPADLTFVWIITGVLMGCCCCLVLLALPWDALCSRFGRGASQLKREAANREAMPVFNGPRLGLLFLSGKYFENNDVKPTSYRLDVAPCGTFNGSSTDDDGMATVHGKVHILSGADSGSIAWNETRQGVRIEASGSIHVAPSQVVVRARYISSYRGTQGRLEVSTTPRQGQIFTGQVATGQVVTGQVCAAPLQNYAQIGGAQVEPTLVGLGAPAVTAVHGAGPAQSSENNAVHQGQGFQVLSAPACPSAPPTLLGMGVPTVTAESGAGPAQGSESNAAQHGQGTTF